jgi:hypothetical protein
MAKPQLVRPAKVRPAKVIPLDDAARRRVEILKGIEQLAKLVTHIKTLADFWGSTATRLLEDAKAQSKAEVLEARKKC